MKKFQSIYLFVLVAVLANTVFCYGQKKQTKQNIAVSVDNIAKDSEMGKMQYSPAVDLNEYAPFLTGYYYADSKQNLVTFRTEVEEIGRRKAVQYMFEDGFQPRSFSFPSFPAGVRLALFFRRAPNYDFRKHDLLFEYKLVDMSEKNSDTSTPWSLSSSVVVIPKLASSTNYMLMIRFKGEGNKISAYFFKSDSFVYPYFKFLKKHILVFLVLFLMMDIYLLYRYLNTKRRTRQYQLELKSLFAQLNPHFIFNSLSSIQGLINTHEIEKANQYLSGFSGLLRTTLDKGGKELISLGDEIENLKNYIYFEQLRFNFKFEIDLEPYLPIDDISILPLLTQPLIENSVKHGISGMAQEGMLSIRIYTVDRDMLFAIKDNGKGFDVDEYQAGYGVALVKKRIEAYNKWHHKTKINFTMKSAPGNTVVQLQFEKWLPK